jgi:hypothetical protein
MGAENLSSLLWLERDLLDLLTFKLEEEQLLLTAGKSKWLQHASLEVEQVLTRLREAGLARVVATSAVALEWGVAEDATLAQLAAAAPAPWAELLRAHLEAMTAQTNQIKNLRDENEQYLRAAARSAQETIATLLPDVGTYDAHGTASFAAASGGGHLFDKEL